MPLYALHMHSIQYVFIEVNTFPQRPKVTLFQKQRGSISKVKADPSPLILKRGQGLLYGQGKEY